MENKEIVTSGKMTQALIGNWLLWGLIFGVIYSFIYSLTAVFIESMFGVALVAIVLQGITAILIWKYCTLSSFKKKTIAYDDVQTVMKNLVIFTIAICIITAIYNIYNVNATIDKALESNYQLRFSESMMSYLYDDDEMAEYQAEKEKAIQELKTEFYTYLIVLEIGVTAVYLGVLPLEKKYILKYVS